MNELNSETKQKKNIIINKKKHLWTQNTYDLGTWIKERMMRDNTSIPQHLNTNDHRSINIPTTNRKIKDSNCSWIIMVDITLKKETSPLTHIYHYHPLPKTITTTRKRKRNKK